MSSELMIMWRIFGKFIRRRVAQLRRFVETLMRKKWATAGFLGFLILGGSVFPGLTGDSDYGKVTEVKSPVVVTFDSGADRYDIRLIGIDPPKEGPLSQAAMQFISNLVLGKKARMRFEFRTPKGEMLSRLFIDDPVIGIKEVGVEMVRAGLAQRQPEYDYKYGELSVAENEARTAKRGVWAVQPK